ncbi:hypothetical protein [Clostridium baratii]|uniref:hypothetical protein n=1 Tax=Clostridium baratii TaxID=1561 RepID=UPI0030CB0B1E
MKEKNKTAPENQEQYVGKCNKCNYTNNLTIPNRVNIYPKYCIECGSRVIYQSSRET